MTYNVLSGLTHPKTDWQVDDIVKFWATETVLFVNITDWYSIDDTAAR